MAQCTAKSKRTGDRCGAKAMRGSSKCYHHGGRSLKGIAAPSFATGRYSAALPVRLRDTYQQSVSDPDLLELRSGVALLDSLLAEAIGKLDTGESGKVWDDLRATWRDLRHTTGTTPQAKDRRNALMLRLGDLIETGSAYNTAINDVQTLLDNRRKLTRDEAARLKSMNAMIGAEQAMSLVQSLAVLVRENVTDQTALRAIADGMALLVAREGQVA